MGIGRTQLDTLRLYLIKIGCRVRQLLTRVRLHFGLGAPQSTPMERPRAAVRNSHMINPGI